MRQMQQKPKCPVSFLNNVAGRSVIGLMLAVVLFFAVNIFAQTTLRPFKWDLTEGRLYTLSDSTYDVLSQVDEPITIKFYFSQILSNRVPAVAVYRDRIKAILEQYADLSGGRVHLEYYDPEPYSEIEDSAVAFGLQGIPVTEAGDQAYFGLAATNATDDYETIPFFSNEREEFLEYDLTRIVHKLANPDKPVVGLLSTFPMLGDNQSRPPMAIMGQIMDSFQTRFIDPQEGKIPDDVKVLLIVHPHDLPEATLYEVDQFIMHGGRAMVFVDPHAEIDQALAQQQGVPAGVSDFNRLLNAWGVNLVEGTIAADLDTARRVTFQDGGQVVTSDFVAWLALTEQNFDTSDTVMNELSMINMATPGVLEKLEGDEPTVVPLIGTGPRTMRLSAKDFGNVPDVVKMFREFKPSGESLVLAARISGAVKSAFPEGRPDGIEMEQEHLSASASPANLIVVADVDMLQDRFWVEHRNMMGQNADVPLANNGDFVINSLENLSGSLELISLRGRRSASHPFKMVEEIRQEAEQHYRNKEQELRAKLSDVEAKISEIVSRSQVAGAVVISDEDQKTVDTLTGEMLDIRSELRAVQHDLRKDIERLESILKFLNIGAVPLLLAFAAIGVGMFRRIRSRRAAMARLR